VETLLAVGPDGRSRCRWGTAPEEYLRYHDEEWGRPVGDDRLLFERLCLEGFQAGLSWLTILRKREAFRAAFDGFAPATVAAYGSDDVERLLAEPGIVRHRGKIEATIGNARAMLRVVAEVGSFAAFLWSFAPGPRPPTLDPVTPASTAMARELRRRGFRFVGPTTCHALMQATGMVNDHVVGCWVREEVERRRLRFRRPDRPDR